MAAAGSWAGGRAVLRTAGLALLVAGSACAMAVPPMLAGRFLDAREAVAAGSGRGPGSG